jgi:histidinol dehydrogenase
MTHPYIQTIDLTARGLDELDARFRVSRDRYGPEVLEQVREVIAAVDSEGDEALVRYSRAFDGADLKADRLRVTADEINRAASGADPALVEALKTAAARVREFHRRGLPESWRYRDEHGNSLGQKRTPLRRVGIYVPGGKAAYPSTVIMTAVPALAAGVREIVIVSPPGSFDPPSALCAAIEAVFGGSGGVEVYRVGGVQAVAALALGTDTIEPVDKIVGPGNRYVTAAKKELFGIVDIDMLAGPSEVLIISDGSVDPRITAADLLAQAEHDEDARAMCVTTSRENAREIARWTDRLTAKSPRREIIGRSLKNNGAVYVVDDLEKALFIANRIAPEHLEIQTRNSRDLLDSVENAGAIFLGPHSAEAYGDYIAGPSHVLPTGGTARFFSPLNTLTFMKFSSVVDMSREGVEALSEHARIIAEIEGLRAHADSITSRRNGEKNGE